MSPTRAGAGFFKDNFRFLQREPKDFTSARSYPALTINVIASLLATSLRAVFLLPSREHDPGL
jgi:hypothetical protein